MIDGMRPNDRWLIKFTSEMNIDKHRVQCRSCHAVHCTVYVGSYMLLSVVGGTGNISGVVGAFRAVKVC